MYSVLYALQICAVILSFACGVVLIVQKTSTASKLMLVTCLCILIQNGGYLLEMQSTTLREAMYAIKMEYLGGAFIMTLLTIFVFRFCNVHLFKWVQILMFTVDISVILSVWCYEYIHIYYKGASFVTTGVMPHVVLDKGFLYIVYAALMYFQFIACAVVSMMAAIRSSESSVRGNYILLFITCAVPCVFYFCGAMGVIDGYDSAPIGGAVGIIIFGYAVIGMRILDVVETAKESILMELDDAVIVLDNRKGFMEANKSALDIFPYLEKVSVGQMVPSAEFNKLLEVQPEEDIQIGENYYKVHVNKVYARGGIASNYLGYSIVLFDITNTKEQMQRMEELRVQADSANQAKSSFLANVSHEIRTPINVVIGMSDVILRDYDEPQLLDYAGNIQSSANTLLDLINDILDFSKIESGRVNLVNDVYRVDQFFRDILMVFNQKKEEKDLEFNTQISENIPRLLYGDVVRIRQVVTNILMNAFKYTKEGGVTLKADFSKIDDEHGKLIICVEDTGIGIKQEELDSIFEVFVRLDERINKSVEGTGLGLNITKNLIELMDGDISVTSKYGKGSCFTVVIPQVIRCSESDTIGDMEFTSEVVKRKSVGYEAPDAKVLIIDDVKTNLIVAKALLRDTKVKITTGASGLQCLDLIKNEHFDVIFLDHRMPGMDGVETLQKMKNSSHMCVNTPVIMLTANAIGSAADYYKHEGFSDFITKPVTEEALTTILKKHLPDALIIEK